VAGHAVKKHSREIEIDQTWYADWSAARRTRSFFEIFGFFLFFDRNGGTWLEKQIGHVQRGHFVQGELENVLLEGHLILDLHDPRHVT
jgi:hypothetical protein